MPRLALFVPLALLLALPLGSALLAPAPEAAEPQRLIRVLDPLAMPAHAPQPAPHRAIGPGSHLLIEKGSGGTFACTANFVWTAGGKTYLGTAGHCVLPEGKTSTHGPDADFDASNVRVDVCRFSCLFGGQIGFTQRGVTVPLGAVVYARQTGDGGGIGNDFALIEIPPAAMQYVNASLPVWNGPTSAQPDDASGTVCMYGNGFLVGETFPTMARVGLGLGSFGDDWQAALSSNVGDSGAAVVTCETHNGGFHGIRPVGVLTHGIGAVATTVPAFAFGTTTERAVEMAREAGLEIALVTGL